jgi:dTDP-4-amino-4,6-dideoxygalactose transaminase
LTRAGQGESSRVVGRYEYAAQFGDELDDVLATIREVLLEGRYGLDREVERFENEFAAFLGVRHACGVNTGTDALVLALRALGIGPGDEVITQANTFNATVAAICLVGASPVLVDANERTFLIDESALAGVITTRTRAIVPVHLYGKPTPLETIELICGRSGIELVEDAAQAHGARLHERPAGTTGAAGCFSFHPSKNLASAGDGGAVVTDRAGLAAEVARGRVLGQQAQNDHVSIGIHSKLHALQAIVLSAKLPKLDAWNVRRRDLAGLYRQALAHLPVGFQAESPGEEHVYHLFQLRTPERDGLLAHLRAAGVDAVVRYPVPIHLQPAFSAYGWREGEFPVAERLAQELLCLPLHPTMASEEVAYVAECVEGYFR